ncbi:MAG: hypothetical protein CMJ81_17655 [Planctomycetaceae bacterium]|nr:hypothetical protein [Planctomycetaceae bacterium]
MLGKKNTGKDAFSLAWLEVTSFLIRWNRQSGFGSLWPDFSHAKTGWFPGKAAERASRLLQ